MDATSCSFAAGGPGRAAGGRARQAKHERERAATCGRWRRLPATYFADSVDLIMDNKRWEIPTNPRSRKILRQQKVRFWHPSGGVQREMLQRFGFVSNQVCVCVCRFPPSCVCMCVCVCVCIFSLCVSFLSVYLFSLCMYVCLPLSL